MKAARAGHLRAPAWQACQLPGCQCKRWPCCHTVDAWQLWSEHGSWLAILLLPLLPLLSPADVGFGVGHTRETETKGIWVWGEPKAVNDADGERLVSE